MNHIVEAIFKKIFINDDAIFEAQENLWNNFIQHRQPSLTELRQIAINGGYDLKEVFQARALGHLLTIDLSVDKDMDYSFLASLHRNLVFFAYDLIISRSSGQDLKINPFGVTKDDWQQQLFWLGLSIARVMREMHPEEKKSCRQIPKNAWCLLINTAVNTLPTFTIKKPSHTPAIQSLIRDIGPDDPLAITINKYLYNSTEEQKLFDAETEKLIKLMSYHS